MNETNWNFAIEIDKNDVNNVSFNNYLNKVNSLIMSYVPIKKLYMQQQKYFALVNCSYTKLHLVEEQAF